LTSTAERESADPGVGAPGRRARWATHWRGLSTRRRWVLGVALGLLASLVLLGAVYVWWLGGGLLRVYTTGQAKADIAQKQLKLMQKDITAGDEPGARRHLSIAERAVNDAEKAARAPQVRVAKWLPYTRGTVTDLDHLLGAASVVIDAADNALTLYTEFSGDTSKLFDNGKVDINALVRGRDALREMERALTEARSELLAVKGTGPLGDDALKKKRTGLKQIRDIRAEIRPYAPLVEALPAALGAEGTKRYLVAVMNPAEMRGSGGAPLSVALVVLKDGKLTIPKKGTTSSITLGSPEGLLGDNPFLVWKRVPGDPFQPPPGKAQRFVNITANPDFRVSGEQLVRATPAFFGMKTDGVIAVDVVALAKLLQVIGPIQSDYGTLTSQNLVQELLVKAYDEQGVDVQGRQARNDALMSVMLSNLTSGGQLRAKADALLSAAPTRHVQMYFQDDRLEALVRHRGLDGSVPSPSSGDLTAVYTQNGNGSKVDVYQKRTVTQAVQLHADGSATVRRTVRIENATPPYNGLGPDTKFGYTTRWATNLVISLFPRGARVTQQPESDLPATVKKDIDQAGRPFGQAAVVTSPGGSSEVSWEYELPRAAVRDGASLLLKDTIAPQNTVNGFLLQTTVTAPDGWTLQRVDDTQAWYLNGGQAFLQIGIDGPLVVQLRAVHP
jgi:hypothetical protein